MHRSGRQCCAERGHYKVHAVLANLPFTLLESVLTTRMLQCMVAVEACETSLIEQGGLTRCLSMLQGFEACVYNMS